MIPVGFFGFVTYRNEPGLWIVFYNGSDDYATNFFTTLN